MFSGRLIANYSVAWPAGLIALGTIIRIPQLFHGLNEMHAFRQSQTTYVALEYARHGINLFHTPLPVFGRNSDVPFEFPLVQAAAALLIRLGVGADTAMRIIGLAGFQVAAVLLFVLVLRWHGRAAAVAVALIYEFAPFGLAWGAAAFIDFPAVAFSLGMVVGLDAWFRAGSRQGLVLGALSAWLAFLIKANTPPAWCLLVVVSAAVSYLAVRSWSRITTGLLVGPAPGVALGLGWSRYADSVKNRNPVTQFLVSSRLHDWYFGPPRLRLDPDAYARIFARVDAEIAGPLGLGLLFAVFGIILARGTIERMHLAGWLATAAAAPLIFFNLYYVHNYYLIGSFPAIAAAAGAGIVSVVRRIRAGAASGPAGSPSSKPAATFIAVEAVLGIIGGLCGVALYALFGFVNGVTPVRAAIAGLISGLLGAGAVVLMRLLQGRKDGASQSTDYLAAVVCGLLWPLVLLPYLGITPGALATGAVNLTAVAVVALLLLGRLVPTRQLMRALLALGAAFALLVALLVSSPTALDIVNSAVRHDMLQWRVAPDPDAASLRLRAATKPYDLIIIVGCDWNPATLFFADRRGLMLRDHSVNPWSRENINDYHYVFSCDPSLNAERYLPAGYRLILQQTPGLWRVVGPPA